MLIENIRFTDERAGDVEVDLLLFLADCGIATIEVKGGRVEYSDGEWWSVTSRGRRRIRPIEQARRAKHALRGYFGRHSEWGHSLPKTEWFVALPNTTVTGDIGPEGRREQLIGYDDLDTVVQRIKVALTDSATGGHVPSAIDVELALALLRGSPDAALRSSIESARIRGWGAPMLLGLVAAGTGYAAGMSGTALAPAVGVAAVLGGAALSAIQPSSRKRAAFIGAGFAALSVLGGVGVHGLLEARTTTAEQCQVGYVECLPVLSDLDCSQINGVVRVTGVDVYRLDADGDGLGCEWNVSAGTETTG